QPVMPFPPNPALATRQPGSPPELFVIPLKHARAADVAQTINALFGRGGNAAFGQPPPDNVSVASPRPATLTGARIVVPDARVVSRPVVLTANDEQAEVVVGSQRPFVQVSRALPTSDAVRDQVVQYKDVGTKLSVRPTISVDGTVQLHVTQEVSNATAETQFNAPVISTRSIKTDLLVQDNQTIVLGGLTDRQHDVESQGIPILSRIPLLGGFFGRQSRSTTDTELFIFLTPRVIRTDEDAARLTDPLHRRATKISPD